MNEQARAKRIKQIRVAEKLEGVLNNNPFQNKYKVEYDVCESGCTCVYKNGKCIHRFKNDELIPSFNVTAMLAGEFDI